MKPEEIVSSLMSLLRGESGIPARRGFGVPYPKNVVYQKKRIKLCGKDGEPLRGKDGRRLFREGGTVTTVMFDDGIQTQVVQGEHDAFDLEKAVLYAVAKRVYGSEVRKKDKDGRDVVVVEGNGYNSVLKKVCEAAVDQDLKRAEAEERRKALKEKSGQVSKPAGKTGTEKAAKPKKAKGAKKTAKKAKGA